jgi:predicted phage baseplate assembly protein
VADDDMPLILSEGLNFQEIRDEEGKVKDIWVQWKAVEDFYESDARSRHYIADEVLARIIFGDGIRGMIPPIGMDNIRASYNIASGLSGNISSGEITALKTSVSGIDSVSNPQPAYGGSDKEDLVSALERGPRFIKSQGRAVTEEDYESLARESSSSIARTKCIAKGNRIKVVIMQKSDEEKPVPSPDLLWLVREYISDRMPVTISPEEFEVTGPSYREIRISATIAQRSGGDSIALERSIIERLRDYLHPLRGGRDKAGWPFGRSIHFSEIFELLGSIDGVEHINDLLINDLSRKDLEECAETYNIDSQEMICSGEHRILIRIGAGK